MDYLNGLNDRQREAVLHTDGSLLILAGAGSGKTKVVTHKIAYLIEEKGIFPGNILAITFTNKAAAEMKDRVARTLSDSVENMWMGTFHSICVRILRRDIDKIGYNRSFTIYDRDDQITLVKECIKERNLNKDTYKESSVLSQISKLKDEIVDPNEFINNNYKDFYLRNIGELYALYQEKLKQYNALDFDDLIIKTVELLRNDPTVLDYYQRRFKYVFVDEYQDTNKVQYELVKLLSDKYRNICVVGDPDQSIYSWRNADITNILNFEKDFKGATTIMLEQNYRSTQKILDLANRVIKNNSERKDKNLWTDNQEGEPIRYEEMSDSEDEALFVGSKIDELIKDGFNLSDIAILYRTNAQSRSFEDCFMRKNIPYKIVGGLKFYDRKEIKDIVAYLKVLENPLDNISLKRIINVPKRGIGNATIDKLDEIALRNNDSIYGVLLSLDSIDELNSRAKNSLKPFMDMMSMLMAKKETMGIKDFIEEVINSTDYIKELEKENTIESQTRIDNIKEFVSVAIDFEMRMGESDLEEFLANVALLSDVDKTSDSTNVVTMMTVHSSKGLEFPVVFLVGMEEGLFPITRSLESESELEEERRLCYVAVTRAERLLYITNAKIRTIYGNVNYTLPSRFIAEMGDGIEKREREGLREQLVSVKDLTAKKETFKKETFMGNSFTIQAKPKPITDVNQEVNIGDKVKHKKFGIGTIVQVKDRDNDKELVISFDGQGLKRLLLSIAPIEIMR
ncbi:DNA helicase PcrA [Tissierella sp. MB52-C2]|uniref:DNA helicase PcrA n=1 Tax=Tissierella sp. MB52-C2 TaxID=3070999 RepID=UPI00280C1E42|nr:DNA helicase PcrA [Tissierella sp. MB52-C2]WMM23874.1 DNA helicase PcrA [Tissierella sp. MB52-C2]